MKKEEKIREIRKRAYEYAETGEHRDYRSIETRISLEGLPEARHVLDDRFIREQLNDLCKVSNSPEEVERRNGFESWLNETISIVSPAVKEDAPEVSLFVHGRTLFVNGPTYSFEIRRRFGSNDLDVTRVWEESDGQRYRTLTPERLVNSNFNEITGEKAVALIMGLVQRGKARESKR